MTLQEICAERREKLGITYQKIADQSELPLSTVKRFFSAESKAPSFYVVAGVCKVMGISLDEFVGIGDHLTADEKTLQERADGLEHRLENKRQTIGLMDEELHNLRHSVALYRFIILGLSLLIVVLVIWCIYVDFHCADYGIWRG